MKRIIFHLINGLFSEYVEDWALQSISQWEETLYMYHILSLAETLVSAI